jgi:endo-1,4-beta-xylanase
MNHSRSLKRTAKPFSALLILVFVLTQSGFAGNAPRTTLSPNPAFTADPLVDVPIYKNTFEGSVDLTAEGISSPGNMIQINTQNVAYQSGLQSLEASGTLAADAHSSLNIQFSMDKLIHQASLDLSNKNIGFSYFIPGDAPIDTILLTARQGSKVVSLAGTPPSGSPGEEKGQWHYQQFDIASINASNSWSSTNLSNEQARQVLLNSDVIVLSGTRNAAGSAAQTSFLIDDFKWISDSLADHPTVDPNADTIRKRADALGKKIGAITMGWPGIGFNDPWFRYTLTTNFNLTTVGGGTPFPKDRPADLASYQFDFSEDDKKMAWAQANDFVSEAGTGADHVSLPKWVLDLSESDAKVLLENKVRSDVSHFKGQELYWGVMNEVVNESGDGLRSRQYKDPDNPWQGSVELYGPNYSPWATTSNDTSLIEDAFKVAHQADPAAKLYLNDYDTLAIGGRKADYLYNLVTRMKKKGIPIDGVGFEMHLSYPDYDPSIDLADPNGFFKRVDQNIKRYAAAGILVMFTEVECQVAMDDLNLKSPAGQAELKRRQQVQAEIYARIAKLVMDNPNVAFVTFWYLADKPGISGLGAPFHQKNLPDTFLFDKNFDPKPAYQAFRDTLAGIYATKTPPANALPAQTQNTPVVQPAPQPGASAVNNMVDDFENPSINNTFDKTKWSLSGMSRKKQAIQNDGVLTLLDSDGKSSGDISLTSRTINSIRLDKPVFIEGALSLTDEITPGSLGFNLTTSLPGSGTMRIGCALELDSGQNSAFCTDFLFPFKEGHSFKTSKQPVDPGSWHVFRIEIDPATMNIKYSIDGQVAASHIPLDAAAMKDAKFKLLISSWKNSMSAPLKGSVAYISYGTNQ